MGDARTSTNVVTVLADFDAEAERDGSAVSPATAVLAVLSLEGGAVVDTSEWIGKQSCEDEADQEVLTDRDGLKYIMEDGRPKVIVPKEARRALVLAIHEDTLGHLGVPATLQEVKKRFYWSDRYQMVRKVCESCVVCARTKGARTLAHKNFRGIRYRGPRLRYHIDTKKVGDEGHILAVVDPFDSYAILIPLYSKSTAEIVDALVDKVFLVYGFPTEIRTDHAREYGPEFQQLLAQGGVKVESTKGYHGQGNAHVERIWAFVKACLRQVPSLVEWRRQLLLIAFAHNISRKERLSGLSPFEVQFGLPAVSAVEASTVEAPEGQAESNDEDRRQLMALVRANLSICQTTGDRHRRDEAARANRKGRRREPVSFKVGDWVMIYREPVSGRGLGLSARPRDFMTKWIGPWSIIERNGSTYKMKAVVDGDGMRLGQIAERSVMNIKKFRGQQEEVEAVRPRRVDPAIAGDNETQRRNGEKVLVTIPTHWQRPQLLTFRWKDTNYELEVPEAFSAGQKMEVLLKPTQQAENGAHDPSPAPLRRSRRRRRPPRRFAEDRA